MIRALVACFIVALCSVPCVAQQKSYAMEALDAMSRKAHEREMQRLQQEHEMRMLQAQQAAAAAQIEAARTALDAQEAPAYPPRLSGAILTGGKANGRLWLQIDGFLRAFYVKALSDAGVLACGSCTIDDLVQHLDRHYMDTLNLDQPIVEESLAFVASLERVKAATPAPAPATVRGTRTP